MAKIKQSVPSQANNQLSIPLIAGLTGLHSNGLQPTAILLKTTLNIINSLMLFTFKVAPAIDTIFTKRNICSSEVVKLLREQIFTRLMERHFIEFGFFIFRYKEGS